MVKLLKHQPIPERISITVTNPEVFNKTIQDISKSLGQETVRRLGSLSEMDLTSKSDKPVSRRLLVTNKSVIGKDLGSLRFRTKYNLLLQESIVRELSWINIISTSEDLINQV